MKKRTFFKGEILIISNEEYSDYSHIGIYVVSADFNYRECEQLFISALKEDEFWSFGDYSSWLVKNKIILPLEYSEYHLGCYREVNKTFVSINGLHTFHYGTVRHD